MAAASVASMRSTVSPSPSLGGPCQSRQGGVRAAADEVESTAKVAPPSPMPALPTARPLPSTPAARPKPAQSSRTLHNFRVWILCDGPVPLVARFVLASFEIPEDGGVDAVRRALRASALAAPPYNVFVRPWARVAYVKAAEVGDGIRRLDNKQSDTMRAQLAEEARSPGGMVLCVEQTRNPKYKGEVGSPDAQGQTTTWPTGSRAANVSDSSKQESSAREKEANKAAVSPPPPAPELGITRDTDRIAGLSISDDLFARWYALAAAPRQVNGTPAPTPPLSIPPVSAVPPPPPVWSVVSKRDRVVRSASVSAPPAFACVPEKMTSTPWVRRGAFSMQPCSSPSTVGLPEHRKGPEHGPGDALSTWERRSRAAYSSSNGSAWSWGQCAANEWSGGLAASLFSEHHSRGGKIEWGLPCYPSPQSACSLPAPTVPSLCIGPSACGASTTACSMGWFVWYPYPYYSYIS